MDIAALSIASSQTSVQNAASVMVLRKSMDTMEQNSQAMVNLISTAAPSAALPHLGKNVDIRI